MSQKGQEPKTGMARLIELASINKFHMVMSLILSALASIASFIPYLAIYFIIKEILAVWPNTATLNSDC